MPIVFWVLMLIRKYWPWTKSMLCCFVLLRIFAPNSLRQLWKPERISLWKNLVPSIRPVSVPWLLRQKWLLRKGLPLLRGRSAATVEIIGRHSCRWKMVWLVISFLLRPIGIRVPGGISGNVPNGAIWNIVSVTGLILNGWVAIICSTRLSIISILWLGLWRIALSVQ